MPKNEMDTRNRILAATWRLMEQQRGQGVRMQDIAKEAGVSRQAVYLHFKSRTELLVATTHYVDEVCGLKERAERWESAPTGVGLLEAFVDFWGNYIPEIYSMAKALLADYETDEAAKAAWDDRLGAVRSACRFVIESLDRDGKLASEWSVDEAIDMMWSMASVRNWEHLTLQCGWSKNQYIDRMQRVLKRTFVA